MSDQTLAKKFIQPNINHQSEIMFGDQIAESINYDNNQTKPFELSESVLELKL